jgi:hypothetical protein
LSKVAVAFLSVAALVLVGTGAAQANSTSPPPPGYSVADRETLYPGIDFQQITKPAGPVLADVAHIAPGAPVSVRAVSSHDKIPTRTGDLETTSAICRRVGCVVAVNGDFHVNGQPMGAVVTGGRMLRSPDPSRAQIWVDDAGHLGAGAFPWSAALRMSDGSQLPISGVNVNPGAGPVLYTSAWGPATPPSGGIELVMSAADPLGPLNQPVAVTLQGVRVSPGGIPTGGAVIAVPAAAADQLNSVWARVQQGAVSAHALVEVDTPVNAVESIGTTPVVLHDSQPALPWPDDPNVIDAVQPRTLVGWNAAGDIWFVVVDGRQRSSAGLTMAQAASLLVGLGATEGANLDGGGGATFVVGGTVWNQPSDSPYEDPALAERVASNALVLLPRPGGPPAPKLPPRPGAGSESGSSTPPSGGGSTSPDPSSSSGGSAPAAGPPTPAPAPGTGLAPLPIGGPRPTAIPIDPVIVGEPLLGGLLGSPGGSPLVTGLPGIWNTAAASGGGRVLGLLTAPTGIAPVGIVSAGGSGGADSGGQPADPASTKKRHTKSDQALDVGGLSGPLAGLLRDSGLPAPVVPSGRTTGGVIVIQWLFFAGLWGGRRIRRRQLALVGPGRPQAANGTAGLVSSSRRWPRPLMWMRVTGRRRQSPFALVTSNLALKR